MRLSGSSCCVALLVAALSCSQGGCTWYGLDKGFSKEAGPSIERRGITHIGTPEYEAVASGLLLTREQAALRLDSHFSDGGGAPFDGDTVRLLPRHRFLVGTAYVFTHEKHKFGASLEGYYVDGMTGSVERRNGGVVYWSELEWHGWPVSHKVPEDWVYEPPGKQLLK